MDESNAVGHTYQVFTCPVCLRNSHQPAMLRCMHYICSECISQRKDTQSGYITCPFCVTQEPVEQVLELEEVLCGQCKSKDPKQAQLARFQCINCSENLCEECHTDHEKQEQSKQHRTVKVHASKWCSKTICDDCEFDTQREIGFFCETHESRCCGTCAIRIHKKCKVLDVEYVVERVKSESLVDDLRVDLENSKHRIETFVAACRENASRLENQVSEIKKRVRDMRKKIMQLLDDFENDIITKSTRIFENEREKDNGLIKICLRHMTALEQSSKLLDDIVDKATGMNFYDVFKTVENHSIKYATFISDALENKNFIELDLEINSKINEVLAEKSIGLLIQKRQSAQITPARKKSVKRTKMFRATAVSDGKIPKYSSGVYLPNGNVCLVDCNNRRCKLFDRCFQNLHFVEFQTCPWTAAHVGSDELAITLPLENKIHFYKVLENQLEFSRFLPTSLPCWGIAAADGTNMAAAFDCKGKCPAVGIISSSGDEIFSIKADDFEINFGSPWQFDFDVQRFRFLISSQSRDSVICINTKGKFIFEYKSDKLRNPAGVTHDSDGNFYVCGLKSHNVHQITPNGELMRIIALSNLKTPFSICFSKTSDEFLVTTVENREEVQLFSLI